MEEPLLSRLGRLDNILKHLEDIRSVNLQYSPKSSSYASATSSGTLTSDGRPSSYVDFSPKELLLNKHCRPIDDVMLEVESKGTLIERLVHAEDRILKLCLQLEDELEINHEQKSISSAEKNKKTSTPTSSPKRGLKQLVKSCVVGSSSRSKKNQHK